MVQWLLSDIPRRTTRKVNEPSGVAPTCEGADPEPEGEGLLVEVLVELLVGLLLFLLQSMLLLKLTIHTLKLFG